MIGPDQSTPRVIDDIGAIYGGNAIVVGRDQSADITIKAELVSRQHLGIHFNGMTWTLTDYKSTNGTFFPHRMTPMKAERLKIGAIFSIGGELLCQFADVKTIYERISDYANEFDLIKSTHGRGASTRRTPMKKSNSLNATQRVKPLTPLEIETQQEKLIDQLATVQKKKVRRRAPITLLRQQKIEPRSLRKFLDEIKAMNYEQFMETFTYPFLVLLTVKWGLEADTNFQTIVLSNVNKNTKLSNVSFWILASEREGQAVRIGRDVDNDIVIRHPSVSRIHAQIKNVDEKWYVKDLRSTNGLYVNGERVDAETHLGHEAMLRFGGDCSVKYVSTENMWELLQIVRNNPHVGF
jgi:pSer/pThr/pTyr-binding forkhead associated (FHA) protein